MQQMSGTVNKNKYVTERPQFFDTSFVSTPSPYIAFASGNELNSKLYNSLSRALNPLYHIGWDNETIKFNGDNIRSEQISTGGGYRP